MVSSTAKFTNVTEISKTDKARLLLINGAQIWVPFSVINSINPPQKTCAIETWWLIKNNVTFTV